MEGSGLLDSFDYRPAFVLLAFCVPRVDHPTIPRSDVDSHTQAGRAPHRQLDGQGQADHRGRGLSAEGDDRRRDPGLEDFPVRTAGPSRTSRGRQEMNKLSRDGRNMTARARRAFLDR